MFVTGATLSSCKEWDDHYKGGGQKDASILDVSLLDYLQEQPEYSEFMDLLKETGVAEELGRNQILTVWAVNNDNMPDDFSEYDSVELVRLAKNQVNYMSLPEHKFEVNKRINTLARKNILFTRTVEGKFAIDGKEIVEPDYVFCDNGVVHEIAGLMIPRDNVYEAVAKLPDTYSILRDSILSYSDTVFDEENSFPLYVDEFGNTVYDSVFIIENPMFFIEGELFDESLEFTFFKYNNEVVMDAINSMAEDMGGYDNLRPAEIQMFYRWIMMACLYEGYEFDYYKNLELKSIWGMQWKTDVQQVADRNYQRGSNCVIYDISYLRIPRYLMVEDIDYIIPGKMYVDVKNRMPEMLDVWFKHTPVGQDEASGTNVSMNANWSSAGTWFYLSMTPWDEDKTPLWLEVTVLTTNDRGVIQPARFFPGEYEVETAFRPYASGFYNIDFNGRRVATNVSGSKLGSSTSNVGWIKPPLVDGEGIYKVETPGELVIRIETWKGTQSANNKRIAVNGWKFHPDKEIY